MKKYLEPEFDMKKFAFLANIAISIVDEDLGTNQDTEDPTLPIVPGN